MSSLPYDIIESMIQCFGKCFHYKDNVTLFMLTAGVKRDLVEKYRDEPKFIWARKTLTDLGQSEDGQLIQRKLLTEFCKLRQLPDDNVPDRDAGVDALRKLKRLAQEHSLFIEEKKNQAGNRRDLAQEKAKIINERSRKLDHLRQQFYQGITDKSRQHAGYSLEDLLKDLFALSEIEYIKSYRTSTQQIDGAFNFEGFNYLVEAKWRKDQPSEQEIGGFKQKVDGKLDSTRGLFIAVQGFRQEVINQFQGRGSNIIFMNGEDIIHILEGRMDLRDALKLKIEKAAYEGKPFVPLLR